MAVALVGGVGAAACAALASFAAFAAAVNVVCFVLPFLLLLRWAQRKGEGREAHVAIDAHSRLTVLHGT